MQAGFARAIDPGFARPAKAPRVCPVPAPLPARADTAGETSRFSLCLLLVALALGGCIEKFGPAWARTIFQTVRLDDAASLSTLLVALAVSIVLHEAGHLLTAIVMNFEVLGICLGPVRGTCCHGKWRFELSGKLFRGSVSAVPRDSKRWRERVLVVVAGGPAATLLSGLVAGMLLFNVAGAGWTRAFLGALTELSCFLFLLGFVPNGRGAKVRNDARLFSIFWNDASEAQEVFLHHLIARLEIDGIRPRDYPAGLIHAMARMPARPEAMLVYAHTITAWAVDRSDLITAKAWDERALELSERCNLGTQQATRARSACLDLLLGDDLASAKQKLSEVEFEALAPVWLEHQAKAVHSILERNVPEALAQIARAGYALPSELPYYRFERELLGRLHRKALAVPSAELSTCGMSGAV